jgi:uncharacterized protein with HEPN domain
MEKPTAIARLSDILEAVENIRTVTRDLTLATFEANWQIRWIVERGVEIISEASRHLPDDLKARHPDLPWPKIAAIGNVLRHEYQRVAPAVLWQVTQGKFDSLERVCRSELEGFSG